MFVNNLRQSYEIKENLMANECPQNFEMFRYRGHFVAKILSRSGRNRCGAEKDKCRVLLSALTCFS